MCIRDRKSAAPKPIKPKGLSYAERLELEKLPDRIEAEERRVRALELRISDPEFYRSEPAEVQHTLAELEGARAESTALLARWEALETRSAGQ